MDVVDVLLEFDVLDVVGIPGPLGAGIVVVVVDAGAVVDVVEDVDVVEVLLVDVVGGPGSLATGRVVVVVDEIVVELVVDVDSSGFSFAGLGAGSPPPPPPHADKNSERAITSGCRIENPPTLRANPFGGWRLVCLVDELLVILHPCNLALLILSYVRRKNNVGRFT